MLDLCLKLRDGPKGASHEKFHAAPSKKQACFLEGSPPLRNKGKRDLLRTPLFASKKVLHGIFWAYPLCSHPRSFVKGLTDLSWNMLLREPSGDRIARSCRHAVPDLTAKIEEKDTIAKIVLSQYVFGLLGPFQTMIVCREAKHGQAQDRKT